MAFRLKSSSIAARGTQLVEMHEGRRMLLYQDCEIPVSFAKQQ
jgi:hypothetical protein